MVGKCKAQNYVLSIVLKAFSCIIFRVLWLHAAVFTFGVCLYLSYLPMQHLVLHEIINKLSNRDCNIELVFNENIIERKCPNV